MPTGSSGPRRAFVAGLFHETNSFSPIPTNLESFCADVFRPGEHFELPLNRELMGYGAFAKACLDVGIEVSGGLYAVAQPSAPLSAKDYATLKAEVISDLRRAMPVDMTFLFLHGAQVASGQDDVEGDIIAAVRAVIGPEATIGVELDLHGNITPHMLENADLLVGCLEYPHIDFASRATHAFKLMVGKCQGRCRPVTAAWRVPLVGAYPTSHGLFYRPCGAYFLIW